MKIPLHFTITFTHTCTHHERTLSWPGQETHAHLNYCIFRGDNTTQETKDDYRIMEWNGRTRMEERRAHASLCFESLAPASLSRPRLAAIHLHESIRGNISFPFYHSMHFNSFPR